MCLAGPERGADAVAQVAGAELWCGVTCCKGQSDGHTLLEVSQQAVSLVLKVFCSLAVHGGLLLIPSPPVGLCGTHDHSGYGLYAMKPESVCFHSKQSYLWITDCVPAREETLGWTFQ